ncbi:hypothetical protein Hdeb2414_s0011g00374361 [Helianthus debilis subsp. tardiflorus]
MLTLYCMLCRLLGTTLDGRCNRMKCVVRKFHVNKLVVLNYDVFSSPFRCKFKLCFGKFKIGR